jgi:hypothetical protein
MLGVRDAPFNPSLISMVPHLHDLQRGPRSASKDRQDRVFLFHPLMFLLGSYEPLLNQNHTTNFTKNEGWHGAAL